MSSRLLRVALLLLGVASCRSQEPISPGQAEVTDSAGVRVVVLSGAIASYAIPEIGLKKAFTVGSDASGIELYKVSGARFLESGQLVIANGGAWELLVVDRAGQQIRRFGSQGEGPGQFITITSVHVGEGDTIVTYDDRQGRLTQFDSGGHLLATRRMTDPNPVNDLLPLMFSFEGPALAVYSDNRRFGGGSTFRRDTTPLLRFDASSPDPDTISLWPTKLWSFGAVQMGATRAQVAFGPDLLSAGTVDRVALADSHVPQVSVVDRDGTLVMSIRWSEAPVPVTDADMQEWRKRREAELPEDVPKKLAAPFLDVPHNETKPYIRGVAVGHDSTTWIAPSSLGTKRKQSWILIDAQGRSRGGVAFPASANILDSTGRFVAVLDRSDLDVELITVYEIEGLSGGAEEGK